MVAFAIFLKSKIKKKHQQTHTKSKNNKKLIKSLNKEGKCLRSECHEIVTYSFSEVLVLLSRIDDLLRLMLFSFY